MGQLTGKRCLLVGGTGGLGIAAARHFRAEGASLVVAGHDPGGETVAQELGVPFVLCDATKAEQVKSLFETTLLHLGGLDVLYHLAGGSGRRFGDGPLHECSDDGWRVTLDLNLTSVFLTNRAAVRHFLAQAQPGVILNLGSVLALDPSPRFFDTCAYAAAKGAIISLSKQAAARYAANKIRINVLAPGLIDTPMAARAVNDPLIARYLASKQPLTQRPGRAEDCAEAAVFLCGDASRFITGVVLPVDGGWCVSEGGS